jgi:hypothetical protein
MQQSEAGVKESQKIAAAKQNLEDKGRIKPGNETAWALLAIVEKLTVIHFEILKMGIPKIAQGGINLHEGS